jgi:SagB-type dehydrogenase family enzyme
MLRARSSKLVAGMNNWDTRIAREYHAATKHHPGLAASTRSISRDLVPRPYKLFRGLEAISLPARETHPLAPLGRGLGRGAARSSQGAQPKRERLTLSELARLLHYSAGIIRRRTIRGREIAFRAAACTGAAYHIELYVVCGDLDGLAAGVYHYGAHDENLRILRRGDFRGALTSANGNVEPVAQAMIVLTSVFWRNAWRYEERAYRHVFWDSGTIVANLLELAASRGTAARAVAGFIDRDVNSLLGVDGEHEAAACLVHLGPRTHSAEPPPELNLISPEVEAASTVEIEYPGIQQMHQASSLADRDDFERWHGGASGGSSGGDSKYSALASLTGRDVAQVIESRGSARRFGDGALTRSEFDSLVRDAVAGLPLDFQPMTELRLIVNRVEGLQPGVFAYDSGELSLVNAGRLETQAGHAALDQWLAGAAAVNLYFVCGMDQMLQRCGNRGYRAAQLEASVRGGRIYLGATALGLRVTGLTFYDDVAARLLHRDPSATAVLFLVVVGR